MNGYMEGHYSSLTGSSSFMLRAVVPFLLVVALVALGSYFFFYKTLLYCFLAGFVLVSIIEVEVPVHLFIFLLPFDLLIRYFLSLLNWSDPASWKELITAAIILPMLARVFMKRHWRLSFLDISILLYFSYFVIQLAFSGLSGSVLWAFKSSTQFLIFYFVGRVVLRNAGCCKRIIQSVLLSGGVLVAILLWTKIYSSGSLNRLFGHLGETRTIDGVISTEHGLFTSAYNLGFFLTVIMWIGMVVALHAGSSLFFRLASLVIAGAALVPLLYTYSRSAWVALLATLIIGGVLLKKRIMILAAACSIVLFIVLDPTVADRFLSIFKQNPRLYIWQYHLDVTFPMHPIFGNGLGSFLTREPAYLAVVTKGHITTVDNLYFTKVLEVGILVLLLIVPILVGIFRSTGKVLKSRDAGTRLFGEAVLGVILIVFFVGMFSAGWENYPAGCLFWLFAGGVDLMAVHVMKGRPDSAGEESWRHPFGLKVPEAEGR
ncbi:O-antigen ligase family protein [Acidobacteriota bacterium]